MSHPNPSAETDSPDSETAAASRVEAGQPEAPPAAPAAQAAMPAYAVAPPPPPNPYQKTPFLAALLSFLPGLGNIYNGLYVRGFAFSMICFGLMSLNIERERPVLIFAMVFFWFFNVVDAYRQAMLINFGEIPPRTPDREPQSGNGALLLGVAVVLVGLFGLIDHLFPRLDLSVILDFWYLAFLAFGGWLIRQAIHNRRSDDDSDTGLYPDSLSQGSDETAEAG